MSRSFDNVGRRSFRVYGCFQCRIYDYIGPQAYYLSQNFDLYVHRLEATLRCDDKVAPYEIKALHDIYISSTRQSYKRFEIEAVGLVRGIHNPADCMRNITGSGLLMRLLSTGIDDTPVEQ